MTSRLLRPLSSRRGSILVHVLVTSILVSVIAVGLLTFLMLQYKMADLSSKMSQNKKRDEQALSELIANWNVSGVTPCATNFGPYTYTAGGSPACDDACVGPEASLCSALGWMCYYQVASAPSKSPTICVLNADANNIRKIKIVSSAP